MPKPWQRPPALRVLEDGTVFRGRVFARAHQQRVPGEVVFNTAMTGYQEVLTDPSYKGQIVTMTYPLIGTYGIYDEDMESARIQVEAFLVKEYQDLPSNWRSRRCLAEFLEFHGVMGVKGIDARRLTRHIRRVGAMRGIIATDTDNVRELLDQVRAFPGLVGVDMVRKVTCAAPYRWENGPQPEAAWKKDPSGLRVAALDFGPVCGICLGHQLMGLALGGRTFKLKFGHRGANQPVKDLRTGRVEVMSQNHGFCVDVESMKHVPIRPTHINVNDNTLEGMEHLEITAFSVQYHPEAAPGPHDATYLFDRFVDLMRRDKAFSSADAPRHRSS